MDIYTQTIIESWLRLIFSVVLIVIGMIAAVYVLKYIRALLKWASFMARLRKRCRESGVTMTKLSFPYKSVFISGGSSELLLEKDGKLYTIKFFTCLHPKDTYQFDPEGNFHRISNFRPVYLRVRSPFYWGQTNKDTRKYVLPSIVRTNDTFIKKSTGANFREDQIRDAEHILCLNPTSVEMLKVDGSSVVTIFDGDTLCGYTVYSSGRLLENRKIFG